MPQDLSSDQDTDDADAEFVEVDPTGRYGRVSSRYLNYSPFFFFHLFPSFYLFGMVFIDLI